MTELPRRRERLSRLVEIARHYRGWSRRRLALVLGRDASKLVPESGCPKIDVLVGLAEALDWTIEQVLEVLLHTPPEPPDNGTASIAHDAKPYTGIAAAVSHMLENPDQSMCDAGGSCMITHMRNALDLAHEGLYSGAVESLHRGLALAGSPCHLRSLAQAALANVHCVLNNSAEGSGLAFAVLSASERQRAAPQMDLLSKALAHYAHGHCLRRELRQRPRPDIELAGQALADLRRARALFERLASDRSHEIYASLQSVCDAGILQMKVTSQRMDVGGAIDAYLHRLRDTTLDELPSPHSFFSIGWWCICAWETVERFLPPSDRADQLMAILSNGCHVAAERLEDWSMHERLLALEYRDLNHPRILDRDDIRCVSGVMGRFPQWHEVGWQILRHSPTVDAFDRGHGATTTLTRSQNGQAPSPSNCHHSA